MANSPGEMPVPLEVVLLVGPLSDDSKSILKEGHHNQEPTKGGKVRLDRLSVGVDQILHLGGVLSDLVDRRLAGPR